MIEAKSEKWEEEIRRFRWQITSGKDRRLHRSGKDKEGIATEAQRRMKFEKQESGEGSFVSIQSIGTPFAYAQGKQDESRAVR
jgi:hypothetical protein